MSTQAKGTFEVKMNPLMLSEKIDDPNPMLARFSLDKKFSGDLKATSHGEMLSAGTSVNGSAGYVAIEKVTGSLDGLLGSFVLQHSATMTRGTPQLSITVVPDSGTDQLIGLAGKLEIDIEDGKHFYNFQYNLDKTS